MLMKRTFPLIALILIAVIVIAHFATPTVQSPPDSVPQSAGDDRSSALVPTLIPPETGATAASTPERTAMAATLEPENRRTPNASNRTSAPPTLAAAPPPLAGTSPAAAAATSRTATDRRASTGSAPAPQEEPAITQSRPISRGLALGGFTFELDAGVHLPAALLESESALPPAIATAKEGIAREFQREVTDAVARPGTPSRDVGKVWPAAKAKADAQFRAMFGEAAFNEWNMQAAREALPEGTR